MGQKYIILLTFLLNSIIYAREYNIILSVDKNRNLLRNDMQRAKLFINYQKMGKINIKIKKSKDEYILIAGPIEGDNQLTATLFKLKKVFPSAFSVTITSNKTLESNTHNNLSQKDSKRKDFIKKESISSISSKNSSNQGIGWIWWLIGIVLMIAIIFLIDIYITSIKVSKIKDKYEEMKRRQKELERKQHNLFSNLGEDVYSISQDVYQCTQNMISTVESDVLTKKLKHMMRKESKLLNVTEKLLRFLKLKAHKVEIKEEIFNINNMLDDIVGNLANRYSGDSVELIFELDKQLPKYITGDLTKIGEICSNILEHLIDYIEDGEIIMSMRSHNSGEQIIELHIKISQNGHLIKEEINIEEYFLPYFDESTGEYKRLGLFVANNLIQLMDGQIALENVSEESRQISISIPLKEAIGKEKYRKYPLPERSMIEKRVYIANRRINASKALKNLFEYFRHIVTVEKEEDLKERIPDFEAYDIVLIEESLLYEDLVRYIRILKDKKDIKVIGLSNIFKDEQENIKRKWFDIFDKRLKKPLNQERVYLLIIDLYSHNYLNVGERHLLIDNRIKERKKIQFIKDIATTADIKIEDFSDFRGSRILIVEDDEINLKMILKILEKSGIEIETAENGQEALEKVFRNGPEYYDLILMDINMPIMDGYLTTQEIYQIPESDKLPIVALTTLITESEIDRMKRVGIRAALPKPINLGKLYTIFNIYLKKQLHIEKINKNNLKNIKLDGLDIEKGLKYVDNNIIFYKEILEEFLRIYGDSGEKAMKYLNEYRLEELKQLTLDVMGLAGTIGAKDVYHSSLMINRVFGYNKIPLLQHYVKEYSDNIEKAKKAIKQYLTTLEED